MFSSFSCEMKTTRFTVNFATKQKINMSCACHCCRLSDPLLCMVVNNGQQLVNGDGLLQLSNLDRMGMFGTKVPLDASQKRAVVTL